MDTHFETFHQSRKIIAKIVSGLSNSQINFIPPKFNNNIAWNLLHLIVTEQLLCYKLSGLPCAIPGNWIERFKKGTKPNGTIPNSLIQEALEHFESQPSILKADYDKGIFESYSAYTTSANVTLNSIEDAVIFNTFHEGIHLGIILQLLKLV